MANTETEVIINTGSRRSAEVEQQLLKILRRRGFDISYIHKISRKFPLEQALILVNERKPRLVIACGGDGTISDVVDYLVGKNIEIGIVPLGTTNNFARSLNIPLEVSGAVKVIADNKAYAVDLGKIHGDYFTNVTGVGLSAVVADAVTDKAKRRWGRLAYAITGMRQLIAHQPFRVSVADKDRELELNIETHQLIIANGRYHAGKQIAVDARVNNRELLVFALGGRTKFSFLVAMLDFYVGRRKQVRHSTYLIAKHIRIRTSSPQLVELDGEVKFKTPLTAQVAPRAIKVRYQPWK